MSQPTVNKLFVYGTLMSTVSVPLGRSMRSRLRRESSLLGPARTHGRLYDLGSYPGLVVSNNPSDHVHGEVFELHEPSITLPWLDAYEGIGSIKAPDDLYIREARTVWLERRTAEAWVYIFNGSIEQAQHVSGGRWPPEQVS
ncbi:MAG: gamma-glutamylcyclotransferase family protein [Hyphomicrobiaceae bacterium]